MSETISSAAAVRVLWRESSWRCESCVVQALSVLRLYDGDSLEVEHEVMPGAISATSEMMRALVLRHLSGQYGIEAVKTPRGEDPIAIGPAGGFFTICWRCGSPGAYIRARRPGRDWYFCPDCTHQWDLPLGT
jgi:hypothetical protein